MAGCRSKRAEVASQWGSWLYRWVRWLVWNAFFIGVGVTLIFDVASKLAGLGFRCVGQPALDPLDLSIVI